ncbi:MAG: phosphate/phosphite/phosphonate ABC transporter substrate-binding protein, partial [Rhodocyclaceae bacterium]|nr:phosphate/phosphite/phosphonate ABC transporter substrate-binding protein [Rhodocyclaceae bacterium]
MILRAWLLLLLALFSTLAAAEKPFTLGIFAYRPQPVMEKTYAELGRYLSDALPEHHLRIEYLNIAEMEAALTAGRLDFVFANPSQYIILRHKSNLTGVIATLENKQGDKHTARLGGVILARADDQSINQLTDLAGKRIAIPGIEFLGAYQAQALELLRAGVNLPRETKLISVGSQDRVVEMLLTGLADVGFVRTSVVEAMLQEGKLAPGMVKLINRQEYPNFPFIVSTP